MDQRPTDDELKTLVMKPNLTAAERMRLYPPGSIGHRRAKSEIELAQAIADAKRELRSALGVDRLTSWVRRRFPSA